MASTREIKITSGTIKAKTEGDLTWAYGVPFAQAKRFEVSSKPASWTETRDCTQPGPLCPQLPLRLEFVIGLRPRNRPMIEHECLNLSVITPVKDSSSSSKLPVIVWYHGGANVAGGADLDIMDTTDLARRGVVTVNVQYRLGIFGCLEIDSIAPANLHVLDQIAALEWVAENIEAFGGDPSKVTIMGQSAGGAAVYSMLLSQNTSHLYHRAIMLSAPLGMLQSTSKDNNHNAFRAKELLGGSASTAASKTVDELLEIQEKLNAEQLARGGGVGFWPTWGKHPLPAAAEVQGKVANLASSGKELFLGWAADDCMPFFDLSPHGAKINSIPLISSYVKYGICKVATAFVFKSGAQKLHQAWTRAGGKSSTYVIQWFPVGSPLRAAHCIDLPLLFGDWETWKSAPIVHGNDSKEILGRLAPEVRDLFVEFVKDGFKQPGKHIIIDENFRAEPILRG